MKVSTEVVRNVFDDDNGVAISVGPDADGLGCVEIVPMGKKGVEFYGDFRISLPPEIALALGHALVAAAIDLKPQPVEAK